MTKGNSIPNVGTKASKTKVQTKVPTPIRGKKGIAMYHAKRGKGMPKMI